MKYIQNLPEPVRKVVVFLAAVIVLGAISETIHWAFFTPKPIFAWVLVFVTAVGIFKGLHWQLFGREEELSQDQKDYAAWFDA